MTSISPDKICFGLSEDLDKRSFSCYLQLVGKPEVAELLAKRMSSAEIEEFINHFSTLLKKHFDEKEYHTLFLGK